MYNFQNLRMVSYDSVGDGDFLPLTTRNNHALWQGNIDSLGSNYTVGNLAIANYNGFINIRASLDIQTMSNTLFDVDDSLTPYQWLQKLKSGSFGYTWAKGRKYYIEEQSQWVTEYETFATKENSSTGLIEDFPFYFSETLDPIRVVCEFWDYNGEKIFDVTEFFSIISERSLINLVRAEPLESSPEILKPLVPFESPYKKVFKLAKENEPQELQWFAFDTYSREYSKDQNQKLPKFSVSSPDKPESSEIFRYFYFWLDTDQDDFRINDLSINNFSEKSSGSSLSAITQKWDVSRRNFDYTVDEENMEATDAIPKNDNSTDNDDRGKHIFVVIKETWATINPSIDRDTSAGVVFGGGTIGDYSDFVKYESDSKDVLHVNGYTRKFVDIRLTNVYAAAFYNPYKVFKVYNGLTGVVEIRKIVGISESGELDISEEKSVIPDISNPSTVYTFDLSDPSCKNLSFGFGSSPGANNYSEDSCWSSILDGPDCLKEIGPQGGDNSDSSFSLIEVLTPPPLAKSMFVGFYTGDQDNFSNSSYSNPASFYYSSSSTNGPIAAAGSRVIDVSIIQQNEDNTVDAENIGVYMNGAKNATLYIGREEDFVIFDQSHYSNSGLQLNFTSIHDQVPEPTVNTFGTTGFDGRTTFVPTQPQIDKTPVLISGYQYLVGGVGGGYIGPPQNRNFGSVSQYSSAQSYGDGLPWAGENSYDEHYNKLPEVDWATEWLQRPKIYSGNMGRHNGSDATLDHWENSRTAGAKPAIYIDGEPFNGPTPFISYNIQNRDSFGKMLNPYIEITLTGKISPFEIPENNFDTQVTFDNILGQHQSIYNQCYEAANIAIVVNGKAHVKFGDVFCKSVSFEEGTWTDYSNFRAEFTASFASGDYTSFYNRPDWLIASGMIDDYDISSSVTPMEDYSYSSRRESTTMQTFMNAQSPGVYQETQRAKIAFKPYVREKWEQFEGHTIEEQKTKKRQKLLFDKVKDLITKANSQYTGPLYSGVLEFSPKVWRYNKQSTLNYNHTLGVYEWERTSIIAPTGAEWLTNISTSIEASNTDNNMKVTVQGSILGLTIWTEQELYNNIGTNAIFQPPSSGLPITNARDGLAWYTDNYNYGTNSWVYKKASEQTAYILNPSPETVSLSENATKGSIDFNITYGVRPDKYFSGSVSENITVNDTLAGNMFNMVQVMGRANGPMIQDLHSRTEFKRELNIEVILHTAALPKRTSSSHTFEDNEGAFRNSKPTLGIAFRKELNRLLDIYSPASEPGIVKYYQMPPFESWSPLDGRYTCRVSWVYELGS